MNKERYTKLMSWVKNNKLMASSIPVINDWTTRVVYIVFLVSLATLGLDMDKRAIRVVLVCGISFVIVSVFRKLYNQPRPYTTYGVPSFEKKDKKGESMPSRHVFSAFVIAMAMLYIADYLLLGIMLVCGILMAVGRVLSGVHYPKDVIAGAIVGIVSGYIGFFII